MATPPEIQETRGINAAQAGLAIAGALLLLAVLWFAFLRGGGEEDPVSAPPPVATADPLVPVDPVDPPGDGKGKGNGPVETFQVFAPKDPFKPLVTADSGGGTTTPPVPVDTDGDGVPDGGTGTGTDTDGDGVPDGGTDTDTDGDGVPDGDGGSDGGNGNGSGGENVGGHRVSLVDVYRDNGGQRAQVQVDGVVYTVDEGERFAGSFQLLSLNGDCATMLYGDDQFTLCEGEEILK